MREVERVERLLHRAVDESLEAVDPLDDPFRLEVELRQLARPDLEVRLDRVGRVGCGGALAHGHTRIFHLKKLDVKVLRIVACCEVTPVQDI